jgi:outer membrane protein
MERVMKRVSWAAVVLTALAAAPAAAQQPNLSGPLRLAYINSRMILANTPGRVEAESAFAREMAGARVEVERMRAQLDSAVATYNRTQVAMTPAARQTREGELRQMDQRLRERASELDQSMQQREQELSAPLMLRINAVIEGIRAEMNISMIFDAASESRALITADPALDLTPLVIQRLRAAGPPPAGADSTQAAPRPAPADTTRRPVTPPLRGRRP